MIIQKKRTIGTELEIADIDTTKKIPKNIGVYDYEDYTICNSTGIGNDPKKEINKFGSEINTIPSYSVDEELNKIFEIYNLFPEGSFNYSCNLHIHIGVENLTLDKLKQLYRYFYYHQEEIFNHTETIYLTRKYPPGTKEYQAELKRMNRRKTSHQKRINEINVKYVEQATSLDDFKKAVRMSKNGVFLNLTFRTGINFLSIEKHGTIEFRHFTPSFDMELMKNALSWCYEIIDYALDNAPLDELKSKYNKFQNFYDFDYNLDRYFQLTKMKKRKKALYNIIELIKQGVITFKDLGHTKESFCGLKILKEVKNGDICLSRQHK